MNTKKPVGTPLHEICAQNVTKPTLLLKNDNKVWLQWFGESDSFDLSEKQFHFPLGSSAGNFFNQPESFEVIMIDLVKNWPNKETLEHMINICGGGDTLIIYFISPSFGIDGGNGETVPAAGVLPLTIKLADDNCGIIYPKQFFDDSVRTVAIEKFQKESNSVVD